MSNGQKLSEYELWNDNSVITQQTIDFFKQASNNKLNYNVVDTTIVTNGWPELTDGFSYTESNYLAVLAGQQTAHSPNGVNYNKIVNSAEFDICGKLNRGEIDEVWIYNGPWFGFYESTLVGPGAYFINSPPVNGPHGCNRLIPIMGPSVERTVHEAVHNFTHRTESIMTKVYGSWQQNNTSHSWDKFGLVKALSPNYSYSGCGSSHYPPNGAADYDYSNTSATLSNCNDFSNYPNLSDPLQVSQPVTCLIWDCTGLGYYGYWFSHFPQHPGCGPDNVSNDWWTYFTNPALALYPSNACLTDIRIISGNVGIGSAILSYTDGVEKSVTSDIYGNYFLMVSNQWSGTVRPTKDGGYTFSPANREYGGTQSDLYNQDFLAALNGPEISIKGNNLIIFDGDTTPYSSDNTDFGIVAVTSGTVSHTFTISNIGPGDLNLTDSPRVIISGAHASDFSVTVQPVSPIAGSGSTTFTVVFDPSAGGVRSASISIANDDSNENPYNFSIQGTGDIYPEMDIKGNNISIVDGDSTPTITDYTNFGSTPVASGAISHTFTIYNTGAGNLNLTDSSRVIISGAHASDFSVTLQPSSPILPSGSASFTVVFDPTAGGLRTTSISIANDDPNENPYNFSIQGTGTTFPEIDIQGNNTSILDGDTSPSLTDYTDFGSAEATGGTVNRTFTIYNLGDGNLILTGSPSKVLVFGSSDFTVSVQPVSPIIPGGSTTFTIVFDPSLIGLSTASLNVYSDDSNENPYNFSVQGTTDRFSPDTQIESQPGSLNNDSTPTFTFSGNDGAGSGVASFMCRIDSGTYILCTSPFTSSALADGSHTFDVYAIDLANNADASPASYSWILDTIAPDTTIITKPANLDTDNTPSFTFSGNDDTGSGVASFMCRMDSGTYTLCTSPFTSSALSDGAHIFDVYAIDLANNADASPASYSWVLDATAPIVKFSTRVGTSPTSAASVNFIVTFSESVTGVDTIAPFNDFVLTTSPGINGEFVTGVTPTSGTTYSVNVNTGSGNGTIRLDMVDNNSIVDAASNPLGGAAVGDGDFTTGQVYDIEKLPILTVVKAGTGGGTVTSSSAGINCGADCSEEYAYNTVITLNAAPSSDSMFDGWSGACSGTGSCVVTMIDAKSVTATFALKKFNNPSRWTTAFDLSHGWTVSQYVRTVGMSIMTDGMI
ncbi:MAG: choice-of-anchor D domain-containing protein [Chitinophagaceae bacterium]|nr:choice-of-anchor D domain-containing protein [Chitinophagaceae bacterium]